MVAFAAVWKGLLPVMIGVGVVIGILGSVLTIRKFLKV